jgi:hypothetical protein
VEFSDERQHEETGTENEKGKEGHMHSDPETVHAHTMKDWLMLLLLMGKEAC